MHVRFANGFEVRTISTGSGYAWRQHSSRAWFMIPDDHPLTQAAIAHWQQQARNRLCCPEADRDMARCLC